MKNIFFGCSMRGGDAIIKRSELSKFPKIIEKLGHKIMSKHQTKKNFLEGESGLTNAEIHDRDYKWLKEADAGIFEISNPSLGVGGEISDMLHLGKPVLCLYKKELKNDISAYVLGKENSKFIESSCENCGYSDLKDAQNKIVYFLERHPNRSPGQPI